MANLSSQPESAHEADDTPPSAFGRVMLSQPGQYAERPDYGMRITLTVTPGMDAIIDNLAEQLNVPKSAAIQKAIGLLKTALDARKENKRIVIVDDAENSEQEIAL